MEKTIKKLDMIKEYIIPTIIFLFGLGVLWASVRYDIVENAEAIEFFTVETDVSFELVDDKTKELQVQCEETDKVINLILQQLVGIDVKLDYIIKELDSK